MVKHYFAYSFVQVSVPTAQPGDEISGFIQIQAYKSIPASQLLICIACKEFTRWSEYQDRTSFEFTSETFTTTIRDQIWFTGKLLVFKYSYPIYQFNSTLPKGQFSIPFTIRLPINALPSFNLDSEIQAKRYYTIKARLESRSDLKATRSYLWIPSLLDDVVIVSPINTVVDMKVINCYCINKGYSIVTLDIDKNAYLTCEKINGRVKVDCTRCKKKLVSLSCRLYRTVRVRDNSSHSYISSRCICKENLNLPRNFHGDVSNHEFEFDLNKISGLWQAPSTSSNMMECGYEVRANLLFDTCCSGKKYEVSAYLSIYNNFEISCLNFMQESPGLCGMWNPVVLSSKTQEVIHSP